MSFLDKPQPTLSPDLFDPGTNLLNNKVKALLEYTVRNALGRHRVLRLYILGSMAGYQFNDKSDIDVNIILASGVNLEVAKAAMEPFSGHMLFDTQHPITFFVQEYNPQEGNFQYAKFGVFNVFADQWESDPAIPGTFEPNEKFRSELATAKALTRSLHREVHDLTSGLDIRGSVENLIGLLRDVDHGRKFVYAKGWGIPRETFQNVAYKYIEKGEFGDLLKLFDDLEFY